MAFFYYADLSDITTQTSGKKRAKSRMWFLAKTRSIFGPLQKVQKNDLRKTDFPELAKIPDFDHFFQKNRFSKKRGHFSTKRRLSLCIKSGKKWSKRGQKGVILALFADPGNPGYFWQNSGTTLRIDPKVGPKVVKNRSNAVIYPFLDPFLTPFWTMVLKSFRLMCFSLFPFFPFKTKWFSGWSKWPLFRLFYPFFDPFLTPFWTIIVRHLFYVCN